MSAPVEDFTAFMLSTGPCVIEVGGVTPTHAQHSAPRPRVSWPESYVPPKVARWRCVYCEARVAPHREKCNCCGAPRMVD